jgi:hypothetical protein
VTGSLEPPGPDSVDLVASALTASADLSDVGMFVRVFTRSFADALPAGMVDVDYDRSLSDRLSGRPGTPVAVRIDFPGKRLELHATRGWPDAEVQQVVRGVVLSRRAVPVHEWVHTLAAELTDLATRNAQARAALAALLGSP